MLLNFFSQISKISNLPSKNDDGKKIISLASHKNKRYPSPPPSSPSIQIRPKNSRRELIMETGMCRE